MSGERKKWVLGEERVSLRFRDWRLDKSLNLCSPQELRVLFFGPAALDLEPAALGLEVSPLLDRVGVVRGGRIGLAEHVGEEPVGSRIPAMMRFGEDV